MTTDDLKLVVQEKAEHRLSNRNKPMVKYMDYLHNEDGVSKLKGLRWRCGDRSCPCRIFTDSNLFIKFKTEHFCKTGSARLAREKFVGNILAAAVDSTEPTRSILAREFKGLDFEDFDALPNYKTLGDKISTFRRVAPPVEQEGIPYDDIPERFKYTTSDDLFVQIDTGFHDDNRYVILGTSENFSILAGSKCWIVDGTFHVVPSGFKQLYVIQTKVLDINVPLVYILMKHRGTSDYDNVFMDIKKLKDYATPDYILLDFECAAIHALNAAWPLAKIRGCLFHFGQAVWRNVGKIGLATEYIHNKKVNVLIRMFLSLAFVPVDFVETEYIKIVKMNEKTIYHKEKAENDKIKEKIGKFIKYFSNNFIGKLDMANKNIFKSRYNKNFWSAHDRVLENIPRTTNSLEAWNRNIKQVVRIPHPNIINLIISLLNEQLVYEKKMTDAIKKIKKTVTEVPQNTELFNLCNSYPLFSGLMFLKGIASEYKWKLEEIAIDAGKNDSELIIEK